MEVMGSVRIAVVVAVLAMAGVAVSSSVPATAETAPASSSLELSTRGVVTLLARRQAWIWQVDPNRLQVQEVRDDGSAARLVWVWDGTSRTRDGAGAAPRHAFGLLVQAGKDVFFDLTPQIDTGYASYTLAALETVPGGPSVFAVGAPASDERSQATLYVIDPRRAGATGGAPVVVRTQGDVITVGRDGTGQLQIVAGRYDFGESADAVLRVPDAATLDPLGRPARAVALTTHTWVRAESRFSVEARAPELTPFGVAEAFVANLRRGDFRQALSLCTAEWRRVMGVETEAQLRAYVQATRPHLLLSTGAFQFLGGTAGQEAASILFSDPDGRIYRIRLRLVPQGSSELMVVPGKTAPELRGPWQVDGFDGGS